VKPFRVLLTLAVPLPVIMAACALRPGEASDPAVAGTEPAHEGLAVAAVGGGGGADVMAFQTARVGGELVIGQGQEPDTLYVYGGSMLAASHVRNALYDGPIEELTYDYQPVILERLPKIEQPGTGAALATVTVGPGQRYVHPDSQEVVTATEEVANLRQITARFVIREGVKWQDGTPVTAADSVFSQQLACDKDSRTSKATCERTASYTAIDERTVEWTSLPGFTDQVYFTNFYQPLPRHQVSEQTGLTMAETPAGDILNDETFSRRPLSYGPFQVVEWAPGDRIVLERNPNYWRANEGLPFLDKVVYRFYPSSDTLVAALRTGQAHVGTQDGLDISRSDALDAAAAAGEVTPFYVVGTVWEHIDFNLHPVDGRPAPGACKEVRQAIAYGTDRQVMVDAIEKGKTRVQHSYVPREHWAFPPEDKLIQYPFEPARAATLLESLGFADVDGDGYREASMDITCTITTDLGGGTKDQVIKQGTPLELWLNTTKGNELRQATTLLFQQNMKDIGVKVSLDYMDLRVLFQDGPDGPLFGRHFDLSQFAWLTGVQPPVGLYYCTEIPGEGNLWVGLNETGWCNPQYDQVAKKAASTLERAAALPYYHAAQRYFMDELPVLPLFSRVKVMATVPSVVNFRPNPTANSETWNIESWGFAEGGE
jgi:peptide/nickel transport system substrate-binding protein